MKLENVGNLNLSSSISNWFTVQRSTTSVELQVLPPFDASRRLLAIECYGAMINWQRCNDDGLFLYIYNDCIDIYCVVFLEKQFWLLSYSRLQGQFIRRNCSCLPGMHVCIGASRQTAKAIRWRPPPELKNTMIWPQQKTGGLTLLVLLPNLKFPQPTSARVGGKSRSWVLGKMGDCGVMLCFLGWTTAPRNEHSKRWRHPLPLEFHDLCFRSFERFRRHHVFQWSLFDVCSHTDVLHGWYWMRTGTVYDLNLYTCVSTCVNFWSLQNQCVRRLLADPAPCPQAICCRLDAWEFHSRSWQVRSFGQKTPKVKVKRMRVWPYDLCYIATLADILDYISRYYNIIYTTYIEICKYHTRVFMFSNEPFDIANIAVLSSFAPQRGGQNDENRHKEHQHICRATK